MMLYACAGVECFILFAGDRSTSSATIAAGAFWPHQSTERRSLHWPAGGRTVGGRILLQDPWPVAMVVYSVPMSRWLCVWSSYPSLLNVSALAKFCCQPGMSWLVKLHFKMCAYVIYMFTKKYFTCCSVFCILRCRVFDVLFCSL